MVVLFADTDCDVSPELAKKLGFQVIDMPYSIDGKVIPPYENFDCHTFYQSLRDGVMPSTSAKNPFEYVQIFEPILKEGNDVLYVHFSSEMSGTFTSLHIAMEELKEKYPERTIHTVDTKAISIGALNILFEVKNLVDEGKSVEEIISFVENEKEHFATYFFAEDLQFFKRSGRVTGFSAFVGSMLGIKPMMYMSSDGKLEVIGKQIGRKGAINFIMNKIEELQDSIKDHKVLIANADTPVAEQFKVLLKEKYGEDLDVEVVDLNPTIGAHCGPNAVGVCFHAKSRK